MRTNPLSPIEVMVRGLIRSKAIVDAGNFEKNGDSSRDPGQALRTHNASRPYNGTGFDSRGVADRNVPDGE